MDERVEAFFADILALEGMIATRAKIKAETAAKSSTLRPGAPSQLPNVWLMNKRTSCGHAEVSEPLQQPFIFRTKSSSSVLMGERPPTAT
jgi:hypothetical protein